MANIFYNPIRKDKLIKKGMEGRIQSALKQILMLRKVQVTPGDTFMITDSKSKILLSIYEVWL
jgi:hypothetical protein